jgi:hypothetical protein
MSTEQTSRIGHGSTDRELWSEDLAWFLLQGDAALGAKGTLGSVVSVVQHGGVSGCTGSSSAHDAMIDRIGGDLVDQRASGNHVVRHGRLAKCWHALPIEHRRVLVAHYVGTAAANGTVVWRLGLLAGVAIEQWLTSGAARRARATAMGRSAAADQLEQLYEQLTQWEARADDAEAAIADGLAWAGVPWRLSVPVDPEAAFRGQSALRLATGQLRALRSARDVALALHADPGISGSAVLDLEDLVRRCQAGGLPDLQKRAEDAVRAAHRAWNASAPTKAERKLSKREQRAAEAAAYLAKEGLT